MNHLLSLLFAALFFAPVSLARPAGPFVDLHGYTARFDATFSDETLDRQLQSLKRQFELICGDTFCEGEYSNLVSMEFNCSVQRAGTELADCVWSFAGSNSSIKALDGSVRVNARFFHCHIPLDADVGQLEEYLVKATSQGAGFAGLHDTVLPGSSGKTLMKVLGDCF